MLPSSLLAMYLAATTPQAGPCSARRRRSKTHPRSRDILLTYRDGSRGLGILPLFVMASWARARPDRSSQASPDKVLRAVRARDSKMRTRTAQEEGVGGEKEDVSVGVSSLLRLVRYLIG